MTFSLPPDIKGLIVFAIMQIFDSNSYGCVEFSKLRASRAYVPYALTCLRAYVPLYLKLLHVYLPTCLKLLRAYVPWFLTWLRNYVLTCLYIFFVPTCLCALNYFVAPCAQFSRTYVPATIQNLKLGTQIFATDVKSDIFKNSKY